MQARGTPCRGLRDRDRAAAARPAVAAAERPQDSWRSPRRQRKILLAIDDITERKRAAGALEAAKRQAEQANLGKSRFLAAASHDLRQPLQTLSLLQGLLAKKVTDKERLKLVARLDETLERHVGHAEHASRYQPARGRDRPPPRSSIFRSNGCSSGCGPSSPISGRTKGLGWRVVPSSLTVHSDPRLLEQMFRNLLSNAVKYTTRGKVLLGCRRRGDNLRIEVWDTGIGIPAAQLEAIFEEFHQLDNPARERSRGLGLGLAIVQRLADLLGHRVDVRSRPGQGFGLCDRGSARADRAAVNALAQRRRRSATAYTVSGAILVVEDEPAVREMLELLFDGEGYRTMTARMEGGAGDWWRAGDPARPRRRRLQSAERSERPAGHRRLQRSCIATFPAIILTGDISTDALREIAQQGCLHLNKPVKARNLTNSSAAPGPAEAGAAASPGSTPDR